MESKPEGNVAAEWRENVVDDVALTKEPAGSVTETNTASVSLTAAIAARPPKLWSKNMIK